MTRQPLLAGLPTDLVCDLLFNALKEVLSISPLSTGRVSVHRISVDSYAVYDPNQLLQQPTVKAHIKLTLPKYVDPTLVDITYRTLYPGY